MRLQWRLIAAFCCVMLCAGEAALACNLPAEQVIARLLDHMAAGNERMAFTQSISLRAGPLAWEFATRVERAGKDLRLRIENGPWFLPKAVAATIADPSLLVRDFEITAVTSTSTGAHCALQGVRKPGAKCGATKAVLWVDPATWLVTQVAADYWWGRLNLELTYGTVGNHTVVASQRASIERLGIDMQVRYSDYWFGE